MIQSKYIRTDLDVKMYDEYRGVEAFIPIKHDEFTHYMVAYRHNNNHKCYTLGVYPCIVEDGVVKYTPMDGFRARVKDANRMKQSDFNEFKNTLYSNATLQLMINELENKVMRGE